MKKIVLATTILIVTSAVLLCSFKPPRPVSKPLTGINLYYRPNIGLTRGPINGTSTLIESEVTDPSNWVGFSQTSVTGAYLNQIYFDQEPNDISDGITDGQYSIQEALIQVWEEYMRSVDGHPQYLLPNNGSYFYPAGWPGASPIWVFRSSSN